MKGCLFVFLVFLLLGLALPFFPEEEKGNPGGTIIISIICAVGFGFLSIITWLTIRKFPYCDLVVDEDGIWYKHLGKEKGMVPWERISKIRERVYLRCLDLLDSKGKKLIRVEYQLIGFELLRNILIERVHAIRSEFLRRNFSKGMLYHLFNVGIIFGFAGLGLFIGTNDYPILGYGIMSILVVIVIHGYAVTATGIEIQNGALEISRPIGKKVILFSDITDIRISDTCAKGICVPEVWIISCKSNKPVILRQFGADANMLFTALRKAVRL